MGMSPFGTNTMLDTYDIAGSLGKPSMLVVPNVNQTTVATGTSDSTVTSQTGEQGKSMCM